MAHGDKHERFDQLNEYDEEIDDTEDDLIENYLYLTQRCGAMRMSPTTGDLSTLQKQQHQQTNRTVLARQMSWAIDNQSIGFERSLYASKARSSLNDFNNNLQTGHDSTSRLPPTIYYNNPDDDECADRSFSLVKLFARMKERLKHDRRYKPGPNHELLREEDPQDWLELTKNTRRILKKALLPDGGYDAMTRSIRTSHSRRSSQKKSRDSAPVLPKDANIDGDECKIVVDIHDELGADDDEEVDQLVWNKFLTCARGFRYRRCGVCKAVDRQQYQGQLVYVYGVANNILIDENLKASGLG